MLSELQRRAREVRALSAIIGSLGALARGDVAEEHRCRERALQMAQELSDDLAECLREQSEGVLKPDDTLTVLGTGVAAMTPLAKSLADSIAHEEAKAVAGRCEITLAALLEDSNWAQVFADESYGNVTKAVSVAPPQAAVSDDPPSRSDVLRIVAAVNGEHDESDWIGVFELRDGRYLVASGGCDYTGWDCQAHNSLIVCASMANVLVYGLTKYERSRLGLPEPEAKAVTA